MVPTLYHRLILPADANHKNTLYAGSMLRLALEAGYATAWKHVGPQANLVLRRVLNLECLRPVPVDTVIEIEGAVLHRTQVYLAAGLIGTPLEAGHRRSWQRLSCVRACEDCPRIPPWGTSSSASFSAAASYHAAPGRAGRAIAWSASRTRRRRHRPWPSSSSSSL